ncbi:MAG TPA: hypothetical protein DCM64_02695 [Gammaproteobacteria bacterium]|nr:hypothetical protein [Gammaproteobacteria bacterium]
MINRVKKIKKSRNFLLHFEFMLTNIEQELQANQCWQLKKTATAHRFDEVLLRNEFLPAKVQQQQLTQALRRILQHCYDVVPYYRQLFRELNISRRQLRDRQVLSDIPVLEKVTVDEHSEGMQTVHLWPGHKKAGSSRASGISDKPRIIRQTDHSLGMFRWLKQRELRWFRFDPAGSMLSIRPSAELPRMPDGSYIPDKTFLKLAAWPVLGGLFETGEAWALNDTNPIDDQLKAMTEINPTYLVIQAANLEHLSEQSFGAEVLQNLQGVLVISQPLAPTAKASIENKLQLVLQQNYGLSELGLVASYCTEGGRFHVHAEHCHVEIVKSDGVGCEPGETGKLLVTGLSNPAMPLIRYETGDLAKAVEGPCPCGRTLPSFIAP